MKLSAEIKKYFKTLGIPVRTRTVAVKHPFVQVWIECSNSRESHFNNEPMKYEHEFPADLRQKLLTIIYGAEFITRQIAQGYSPTSAGNIRAHSISVNENEWRQLMAAEGGEGLEAAEIRRKTGCKGGIMSEGAHLEH